MTAATSSSARPDSWQAAFDLIRTRGYERRDEPFRLASGQLSHDYIDGKYAVDNGERLATVCRAVADLAAIHGVEFDVRLPTGCFSTPAWLQQLNHQILTGAQSGQTSKRTP